MNIGIFLGFGAWKLVLAHDPSPRISFFEKAAPYYDTILDLLTFKQYAGFEKEAVKILAPQRGEKILDLCQERGEWSHG